MPSPLVLASPARMLVSLAAAATALQTVPWQTSAADASAWYHGTTDAHERLAAGVSEWLDRGVTADDFATQHDRFDDEWAFGTYFMAAMGFGQLALAHPDDPRWPRELDRCIEALVSPGAQAFEVAAWETAGIKPGVGGMAEGERALRSMIADGRGHAAYLGYLDLVLSLARRVDPATRWSEWNERVSETLAERLVGEPGGIIETYPQERYPVDNAAAIAAIALRAEAVGEPPPAIVNTWMARVRADYLDGGLLVQATRGDSTWATPGRGSGTFLAAYFLSVAALPLGEELYRGGQERLYGTIAGYGLMREYAPGVGGGPDIDSGPIVLGYGVSPTGFALGPARIHRDAEHHQHLFATSNLFGAPGDRVTGRGPTRHYAAGGPLGDAIMFAMLTARSAGSAP